MDDYLRYLLEGHREKRKKEGWGGREEGRINH